MEEIILTTGYRGEQLENLVESWNRNGVNSRVNQENTPMGTAGSVRLLLDDLSQTFVVGSGDSVTSLDLSDFISVHKEKGAKVTMALWKVDDPTEFGIVGLSNSMDGDVDGELSEGYIRKFLEKPKLEDAFSNVINAGLYIIEPEVLEMVPEGEKYDFSKQLFPRVLEKGWPMYAKIIDGIWFDVGNPDQLLEAQDLLISKMDELPFSKPHARIESGNVVHHDSVIEGEVLDSSIDSNCIVESGSTITGSLLMRNVNVGKNCNISRSVIGKNVVISDDVTLLHCIVGDGEIIDAGIYEEMKIPSD